MPDDLVSKQNIITIYIWLNSEFFFNKGHVALQTYRGGQDNQGFYVSFWPHGWRDADYMDDKFMVQYHDGGCFRTKKYDLLKVNKGQPPDYIIHLKNFNVTAIIQEWKSILKEKPIFSIYGSLILTNVLSRRANCTEIVYRLLRKGGLESEMTRLIQHTTGIALSIAAAFWGGFSMAIKKPSSYTSLKLAVVWGLGIFFARRSRYKGSTSSLVIATILGAQTTFLTSRMVIERGMELAAELFNLANKMLLSQSNSSNFSLLSLALFALFAAVSSFFVAMLVLGLVIPVSFVLVLANIPMMAALTYFPVVLPTQTTLKTPESIYHLTTRIQGAEIESYEDIKTLSISDKCCQFFSRNKWLLGIGVATGALIVTPQLMRSS